MNTEQLGPSNLANLIQGEDGILRVSGCDAKNPSIYMGTNEEYICRCIVCGRCGHHTGNSNQGHYWKLCNVQWRLHDTHHKLKSRRLHCNECMPDFHLCCPGNCELFEEDGTRKNVNEQN